MKPEKMNSLSETKLRNGFPQNVKFHFCPVFGLFFDFINNLWRWCGPNLVFFMVISIILSFQLKKNQILKILSTWIFVTPKCQQSFMILQLLWTLTPNKFWTKCFICLIFAQTILFHPHFIEITTLISI